MTQPINIADKYEKRARQRIAEWVKNQKPLTLDASLLLELKSPFHDDPNIRTKLKYNALIYALGYGAAFFDWLPLPSIVNKIVKEAIKWTAGRFGIKVKDIAIKKTG